MENQGRILRIAPDDNMSDKRTPRRRLRMIPAAARESFVPFLPARAATRPGEADMTRIAPGRPRAQGEPIEVTGTVRSESGRPVRGALLEIWSANTFGRYTHIEDQDDLPLDPNFLGVGRVFTDEDGGYRFWTISPGRYLSRPDINRYRPKHIHISISGGSSRLITQMYFAGDKHNDTDPLVILMADAFERNIGKEYATPDIDLDRGYRFDIVVGGRNATFFE